MLLRYLVDVREEPVAAGKNGFHLIFKFGINPYFSVRELRKSYFLGEDDETLLLSSKGCHIDWDPNRNPKFKSIWKKGKQTIIEKETFFDFFDPPQVPPFFKVPKNTLMQLHGSDDSGELDLEEIHNIQEAIEEDFEIGLVIKDVLIPNAVYWFTGEIVEDSSEDDKSSAGESD